MDIPERYVGNFSDYEPLNLTKEESAVLSELNALALQTGAEHGRVFIDGVPQEVFTSDEHNRIFIPAIPTGSGNVKIFHSHTNCTQFSAADLAWLTNPNVDMIGVIPSNRDVFTAAIEGGYLIDLSEFKEVADAIADRVDLELLSQPDFFDCTVEERKYMAIKEQMFQLARQFGWTLRGGRL